MTAEQARQLAALGRAIRLRRQALRLPIEALAHEAELSSGHLSTIERGHGNPRLSTLYNLAEALDTTADQLVWAAEAGTAE